MRRPAPQPASASVQLWLGEADRLALARLARHWDITKSEAVARLVRGADRETGAGMTTRGARRTWGDRPDPHRMRRSGRRSSIVTVFVGGQERALPQSATAPASSPPCSVPAMGAQLSGIPDEVAGQAAAIGGRVAVARRLQRITGAELAQCEGVSRDSVSRLERGDPGVSPGVLLKACAALDGSDLGGRAAYWREGVLSGLW